MSLRKRIPLHKKAVNKNENQVEKKEEKTTSIKNPIMQKAFREALTKKD